MQLRPIKKSIGPALETHQSHTIKYRVSKIVPEGHREGNKSPAALRCSAARRCISVPMCDQSTAGNPHWHIGSMGRAPLRGCIGFHLMHALCSREPQAADTRHMHALCSREPHAAATRLMHALCSREPHAADTRLMHAMCSWEPHAGDTRHK